MISANKLLGLLEDKQISVSTLSKITGINETTISAILRGHYINSKNVNTICAIMGCQPKDIIEYVSECTYCLKDLGDFKFCPMCGRLL